MLDNNQSKGYVFRLILCRNKVNKSLSDTEHFTLKRHLSISACSSGTQASKHFPSKNHLVLRFTHAKSLQCCPTICNSGLWPTRLLCPRGLSRQEHCNAWPCPTPGDVPHPEILVSYTSCTGRQLPYH